MKILPIMFALFLVVVGDVRALTNSTYSITQVTNDVSWKSRPQINDKGEITWLGQAINDYSQIFLRRSDGSTVKLAVDAYRASGYPVINARGDVAWTGHTLDWSQGDVFLYEANSGLITNVTNSSPGGGIGRPDLSDNGEVVWAAWRPDFGTEIFLRKTNGSVVQLPVNNLLNSPRINARGDVVWLSRGENYVDSLFLYEGATGIITPITAAPHSAFHPQINSKGDIAWESRDGDIFLYKNSTQEVIQVTNTVCRDYDPLISDNGDVFWTGSITDCGEFDIFLRKSEGTVSRLTNNPYLWYGFWDTAINANGDAVFVLWSRAGDGGLRTELYAYRSQLGTVVKVGDLTRPDWPQINNRGEIVWQGLDAAGGVQVFLARSFVQAIEQVIQNVISLNLRVGIEKSLDAKLDAASRALTDVNQNNNVAAINSLQAFIGAVEAQRGKLISVADADALIAAVQAIIAQLAA